MLLDHALFDELFSCYFSEDEIVRLRVSNAMKRICKANKSMLLPYLNDFIGKISTINQASTKWTLAQLFDWLFTDMNDKQQEKSISIVKSYLEKETDWIVLNNSMETLSHWSQNDEKLKEWLMPHLKRLESDPRKSVANRAKKLIHKL